MSNSDFSFHLRGEKIREVRKAREISSSELAEKAGVTQAYISQIEHNLVEPSLSVLRKIASSLNVEIHYLFSYDSPTDVMITDIINNDFSLFPEGHAKYQFLTPSSLTTGERCQMSVIVVTIEAGKTDYDEKVSHDFVEFCHVLEGEIEYHTEKKIYYLSEGDSIYIQRNVSHLIYNCGKKDAKVIAVLGSIHPYLEEY